MNLNDFDYLTQYQRDWINDPAGVAIGEKSRRIGFSYAVAVGVTTARIGGDAVNFDYWHSSADQTAALEFIEECVGVCEAYNAVARFSGEPEVVDEKNGVSAFVLRMNSGTKIVGGSSNPKFFRSKGGAVGLDEYAFHAQARELYKAAQASARFWGYPMRIWSTHNGPGSYFNGLLKLAREGKVRASTHRVTVLDAVEQGIVERIDMRARRTDVIPAADPVRRKEWLDTLRAECPDDDVWNEEYLCIPSTDGGAFLDYELIAACEVNNLDLWETPTAADPWPAGRELYAGTDVGRKNDLTVNWVLEKVGDVYWTRYLNTMHRAKYAAQEGVIDALMGPGRVRRLCIDATGIGNQMAERAVDKWGSRVEPVTFTNASKADLALPLRGAFQDRRVRVPATAEVREDLHAIRKLVTAAGNTRYAADDAADTDGHADRFWALGLAYHAAAAKHVENIVTGSGRKPVGC